MVDTNKVNGAAEQLTRATVDSYKALADRAIALQEQNVRFASGMMLNGPIEALHRQAKSNRVMAQALAEQSRGQTEAARELLLGAVDAYMDLFFVLLPDRR